MKKIYTLIILTIFTVTLSFSQLYAVDVCANRDPEKKPPLNMKVINCSSQTIEIIPDKEVISTVYPNETLNNVKFICTRVGVRTSEAWNGETEIKFRDLPNLIISAKRYAYINPENKATYQITMEPLPQSGFTVTCNEPELNKIENNLFTIAITPNASPDENKAGIMTIKEKKSNNI